MTFLFCTTCAYAMDIAYRIIMEGNKAVLYIEDKADRSIGDGIVPKTNDWRKTAAEADVIVCDDTGWGEALLPYRKSGKKVFGLSGAGDKMELKRTAGMLAARQAGLSVPDWFEFKEIREAMKFIQENPQEWVLKPNGDVDKDLSFVGKEKDGSDVAEFMKGYEGTNKLSKEGFILQKKVKGTEIGISAYFDGKKYTETCDYNFEHKALLNKSKGPNTGETGTVIFHRDFRQPLFDKTLSKIVPLLQKSDYRGWIDIETICNERGAWFLEFTCRWGYPQAFIVDSVQETENSKIIHDVAAGNITEWRVRPDFATGVILYSEGYPYGCAYKNLGLGRKIKGINPDTIEFAHLGEVSAKDDGFYADGECGWTLIITGTGMYLADSIKQCYNNVKLIDIPSSGYRTDIGADCADRLRSLVEMGYLRDEKYFNFQESEGFDLDGTLAHYDDGQAHSVIGKPVPAIMGHLRSAIDRGEKVKIFTARATYPNQIPKIEEWLKKNGLPKIEITNLKEPGMKIWDDSTTAVETNTGKILSKEGKNG